MNSHLKIQSSSSERIYCVLNTQYGPLMGAAELRRALGFTTQEAFRQAVVRNKVGVPVFSIPGRRGKFAHTSDVAAWLAKLGERSPE